MTNIVSPPVLLLTFNRPEHVRRMLTILKSIGVSSLYISCDGPRPDETSDKERIALIRKLVNAIDWDVSVKTNFSDINNGCKIGVYQGISWFFGHEEQGIILEDDCEPNAYFFQYCQELLIKYKDDKKVMSLSGTNLLQRQWNEDSYVFSSFPFCWGWATWRRAWQLCDIEMKQWPNYKNTDNLNKYFANKNTVAYWTKLFDKTYHGQIDTWDYQWAFACFQHHGLAIIPNHNLITNVGFDNDATHTKFAHLRYSSVPTQSLRFPLKHPKLVEKNQIVDQDFENKIYNEPKIQVLINLFLGTVQKMLSNN